MLHSLQPANTEKEGNFVPCNHEIHDAHERSTALITKKRGKTECAESFFFLAQLSAIAFNMRKSVSFNSFQLPPHNRFSLFPQLRTTAVGWPEEHGHKRNPTLYVLLYSLSSSSPFDRSISSIALYTSSHLLVYIKISLLLTIYTWEFLLRIEMLNGECLDRIMCEWTQSSN